MTKTSPSPPFATAGATSGAKPLPTCRLAVLKICSRCNLNCSYCYMYNLGDRTALQQPKAMPDAVIDATAERCLTHAAERGLDRFRFVLHGGEPLMAGRKKVQRLIDAASNLGRTTGVAADFAVQTNGILLTEEWCRFLSDLSVSVGVSLDGPRDVNDRQRITHRKEGSYDLTIAGWNLARSHGLRPSILTVVDPETSAEDAYRHLCELQPSSVDFLLPDANHDRRPPHPVLSTPHADWLLKVFSIWNSADPVPFRVRLFEQIIAATLGISYANDALGEGDNEIVVIDTDGEIGPVDTLRAALPGAGRTGFNVLRDNVSVALDHPLLRRYHSSNQSLCASCTNCPINRICGGGYLSHRYSSERGFDNPSVYCRDLTKLIIGIRNSVLETLPEAALQQADLTRWSVVNVEAARI